ncbi:RDD family protein [Dermabacteraceae bacterium P7074]
MAGKNTIITSTAVRLDIRTASTLGRAVSAIIDLLLTLLVGFGCIVASVVIGPTDTSRATLVFSSIVFAFGIFPVLLEYLTQGRSLGRYIMGSRVVRGDGGPVHLRQSLLRAIASVGEIWMTSGCLALTVSLVDPQSRRIGDLLAGTLVIQERTPKYRANALEMPAALSDWARNADMASLPLSLSRNIHRFITRGHQLNEESQHKLGNQLLYETLSYVSPPPPPGTRPELFLRAVATERARRDEARLRAESERVASLRERVHSV